MEVSLASTTGSLHKAKAQKLNPFLAHIHQSGLLFVEFKRVLRKYSHVVEFQRGTPVYMWVRAGRRKLRSCRDTPKDKET
ncbi:MAG: hypothetical protein ACLQU3_30615, partial [Limisphaerales bacterium]